MLMSHRLRHLLATLLLVACAACAPEVGESLLVDGGLALPRLEPDRCAGALRSEVLALDVATGTAGWRREVPYSWRANPLVADGRVIVTSTYQNTWDGSAQALAVEDGQPLWQVGLDGPNYQPPTPRAGDLVVVVRERQVVALRPETGAVVWTQDLDGHPAIAVTPEHVYVKDDTISALELATGTPVWSRPDGGDASFDPLPLTDRLIVANYAGSVNALAISDGDQLWRWTPDTGDIIDVVAATDDHVVLRVGDGQLNTGQITVLDSATGTLRWQGPMMADPVIVATDDLILATERDRGQPLTALDADTGEQRWAGELARVPQWTAATTPTGTVIVRNDASGRSPSGTVTMLNDDGTPRWDITPGFNPMSAAALDGEQLLLWGHDEADGRGAVVLLDAGSGTTTWHATLERPVQVPPLPAGEMLIALASDFRIDCS